MSEAPEAWQFLLFAVSAVIILLHTWRGWRLGPMRQLVTILALGCAYAAAFFGGPFLIPFLKPLGMPDLVLRLLGGALLGTVTYLTVTGFSSIVFKKTSQQTIGIVRFGYGASGALLGAIFGVVNVWVFFLVIRLLGTAAENRNQQQQQMIAALKHRPSVSALANSSLVKGIVAMKDAFDHGSTGTVAERVDPIPAKLYSTVSKASQMMSDEQAVARFMTYPGIKPLTQNARIAALQKDPVIARDALNRNFMALLRNEQIVQAVNDPEIVALFSKFDFEKALDYALSRPDNREPLPDER